MTVMQRETSDRGLWASSLLASEIRAEMGRAGVNQSVLAKRLGVSHTWTSRRLSPTSADVPITLEEAVAMAEALGMTAERLLLPLLPRLDSNQQPSGYGLTLVRGSGDVVDLAAERAWRRAS